MTGPLTGRCYCGASRLSALGPPDTIAYCHCEDCRRWTGAPVAAFAAFKAEAVTITPDPGSIPPVAGVVRRFCRSCGSPLAARFDCLPGQIYLPLGVLDDQASLAPLMHAHADAALPWLCIDDTLPRHGTSARSALTKPR